MEEIKVGKISIPIIEGKQGVPGKEGNPGKPGDDGYSPVKGKDYFTPDEIEDVIGEVTTRAKENLEYEFRENIKDISYDNTTGIMTFIRYDGTTVDVDLPLELIVSSGTYNDTTKELELTLANGQLIKIPLSDLIDDFYIKSEIDQKVNTINGELTNLKTEDSKLQETLTNQAERIEELEEKNEQLLKDYKKIPFNAVSNHLEDTGELPMPISINGGIEQDTREGYNELNPTLQTTTLNGVACTNNNDGTYTLNGTATEQTIFSLKTISLDTSETYTLSGCPTGGNNGYFIAGANFTDYGSGSTAIPSRSDITFSIVVQSGVSCNNLLFKPMLVKGATIKPYEQYGAMPSLDFPSEVKGVSGHYDNVVENKNLLNGNDTATQNGVTSVFENGKAILNGTITQNYARVCNDIKKELDIGTYIFSRSSTYANTNINRYLLYVTYEDNTGTTIYGNIDQKGRVFTTNKKIIKYRISTDQNIVGTTYNNVEEYIQLEKGDKATPIVEHQEQLLPIDIPFNMYSGKPYKENGKWYRKVEYVKEKLTSDMSWIGQTFNDIYRVRTNAFANIVKKISVLNTVRVYSNCFKQNYGTADYVFGNLKIGYLGFYTDSGLYITTPFTILEEWNTYLDENEVYVVFELETPTIEEITDTTLIEQLEELQKAHSYLEVTNINSYRPTENVAEMKLSGNALMSNDIRMSKIENAILSIGGNL